MFFSFGKKSDVLKKIIQNKINQLYYKTFLDLYKYLFLMLLFFIIKLDKHSNTANKNYRVYVRVTLIFSKYHHCCWWEVLWLFPCLKRRHFLCLTIFYLSVFIGVSSVGEWYCFRKIYIRKRLYKNKPTEHSHPKSTWTWTSL